RPRHSNSTRNRSPTAPAMTICAKEGTTRHGTSSDHRGHDRFKALWHARQFRRNRRQRIARREELYPLLGSLIRAELAHRQSRSINYRISGAKFPVLKDLDAFVFKDTPVDARALKPRRTPWDSRAS